MPRTRRCPSPRSDSSPKVAIEGRCPFVVRVSAAPCKNCLSGASMKTCFKETPRAAAWALARQNHCIGEFDSRFHRMKLPRIQFFRKLPYERGASHYFGHDASVLSRVARFRCFKVWHEAIPTRCDCRRSANSSAAHQGERSRIGSRPVASMLNPNRCDC